jgi:hypothetical protein
MRRHGSRLNVVLVPQESPNDHEGGSPIASGIHVALGKTRGNVPAYPVVDSISCDGGLAHGWCRRSPPPVPRHSLNVRPFVWVPINCAGAPARTAYFARSLQCQSAQPLRVALALFRELDNQLGDLVRCWIAAIN